MLRYMRVKDEAKRLADVPSAFEIWDTHVREFEEAGGKQLSFDDKKFAMINIIPNAFKADMMLQLHVLPEPPPGSDQRVQDQFFTAMRTALTATMRTMSHGSKTSFMQQRQNVSIQSKSS